MKRILSIFAIVPALLLANSATPVQELQGVGVEEKLGAKIDTSLSFIGENGRLVQLSEYMNQGRPVVLNFVYYSCPMLCGLVLNGFTASLENLAWTPGKEFEVLTISINPREMHTLAQSKKQAMLNSYGRPAPGWHFLSDYNDNAKKLAETVGFHYRWDEATQQYAHSAALILLTPDGRAARYLYGIKYKSMDLRLGLTEASEGKLSSTVDKLLLYCFHYDPQAKSYVMTARYIMQAGGLLTMCLLGSVLLRNWRREVKSGSAFGGNRNKRTAV